MIKNMSSTFVVTSVGRKMRSSNAQSIGSVLNRPHFQNCPKWRYDRIQPPPSQQQQSSHYMHAMTRYVSDQRYMMRRMDFLRYTYYFAPSRMSECECDTTNRLILYRAIKSSAKALANIKDNDIETTDTVKDYHENSDLLTTPASEHSLDSRNSSSYDQTSNPSFKVSRVTYKTGTM